LVESFPARQGVVVLSVPMAGVVRRAVSIYWVEGDVRNADQLVIRSYDIRAELVQLHSSLLDAESALTGHLATGQPRFLGLLETARKAVGDSQSRLSGVIGGDDPQAIASLNEIRREIVAEMGLLDGNAANRRRIARESREGADGGAAGPHCAAQQL